MKQAEYESLHAEFWLTMESFYHRQNERSSSDKEEWNASVSETHELLVVEFPRNYRTLCQHLAMAKSRRYSQSLCEKLNALVKEGYLLLYKKSSVGRGNFTDFIFYGFPAVLRANSNYLWLAAAVFVLPAILMALAVLVDDQMVYSLMDARQVRSFEAMYDPELRKLGRERQSDSDLYMFGFYIYNNIGVSFRCFATGIFAGIGSLFFVGFNGLLLGGVAGHLTELGFTETFYPFVIGHGAFELTAIVFSGAAGLKLGHALLAPGSYSRKDALQIAAADAIRIIYGSTIMLLIAAFIEAYWSSSSVLPIGVKLWVGSILWVLVFYYCFFLGRTKRAA